MRDKKEHGDKTYETGNNDKKKGKNMIKDMVQNNNKSMWHDDNRYMKGRMRIEYVKEKNENKGC